MMQRIPRVFARKWLENEPELIATLYHEVTGEKVPPSFDSPTNQNRLEIIQQWWDSHLPITLESLSDQGRLAMDIMTKNFGWLVYDTLENLLRFLSSVFHIDQTDLKEGFAELAEKRLIMNYEPLTHYSFLFLSPFIPLQVIDEPPSDSLSHDLYERFPPLIGLLAYLIAYTPRSSEANEIHRIDFQKLQSFFEHTLSPQQIDAYLKSLSHIGVIQKYNNRIVIQKSIIDQIRTLPLGSLFALVFFYEVLEKLEFQKSTFLTLQWLAYSPRETLTLREVFFYYCQHLLSTLSRQSIKSMKVFLQKEEQNFVLFIKQLEKQHIITIERNHPLQISRDDRLTLHPFYRSILRHQDMSDLFPQQSFIVEANGEIIVEPDLAPSIYLELIFLAEPKEIHTISIYQITKKSIYKALAYGFPVESILSFLEAHSRHPLAPSLVSNIRHYAEHSANLSQEHVHILQLSSNQSSLLADHFSRESIEIEPHTFLFFDDASYQKARAFCEHHALTFKENINFLQQPITTYPESLQHHVKHLMKFLDTLDNKTIFLPQQDILKVRLLTTHDWQTLLREKSPEH